MTIRAIVFLTGAVAWAQAPVATPRDPQEVVFTSKADGTPQRYLLLLPEGFAATHSHDLLIALHGHGSDRWQFMRPTRSETRAVLDVAAKNRLILVSPDYRAPTSWMGPKAEADLSQILEELRGRFRIGRVVLCGASMGGSSALTYAALHPAAVDAIASMNGTANHLEYENFQEAIASSFGGSKARIPLEYKNRSAEYWPERLTMPIAITSGGQDDLVPSGSVQRLAAVLQKLGRNILLIHRERGGHETNYEDATGALEFALAAARQTSVAKE